MRPIAKKVTAVAVAAALSVSLFGAQARALQYSGSDSYLSGKYYRNLQQVKLTGDPRVDLVAVARSQVGYQEGNSENHLSGEVYGADNYTEYGSWYGLQNLWCAMFVSWCAAQAGISTDTIPSHCATPEGLSWFAGRGLAYTREDVQARKYTPKPGDIVYFKSSRNAKSTNHVGIVTAYADNRIYTVEGNIGAIGSLTNGGMVAELSYPISNTFIVYICSPAYEAGSTNVLADAPIIEQSLRQEGLRDALIAIEAGQTQPYGGIHTDRAGRVTIGCGQWYGAQALELLRQIRQADETAFGDEAWPLSADSLNRLSQEQRLQLQRALTSDAGIRIQNEWMDKTLRTWMQRSEALGVTDEESLLICAALFQLRGAALAERIIAAAGNAPSKEALLNQIKDLQPGLYRTCCLLVE